MALAKLIVGQMVGAAKNAFKMDIVVDKIKDELINQTSTQIEERVPITLPFNTRSALKGEVVINNNLLTPKNLQQVSEIPEPIKNDVRATLNEIEEVLNKTIKTKNQLQGNLNTLLKPVDTLSLFAKNIGKVIPGLNGIVLLIKNIPIPTSVPPGVGLPSSILTNFADSLDEIKKGIDKLDGPVSTVNSSVEQIQKTISPIVGKLKLLDPIFSSATTIIIFIRTLLDYGPFATEQQINEISNLVTSNIEESLASTSGPISSQSSGVWVKTFNSGNGISNSPEAPPPTPNSPFTSTNGDVWTFFSSNKAANDFLLSQLTQPNNNPLIYRGYKLQVETDPNNRFSFPSRRILATYTINKNNIEAQNTIINFQLRLVNSTIYNLPDKAYSFSSSVQALIAETYYEIDQFISGQQSIQTKINSEYIYDTNGVAVGRKPGFPGYSLGPYQREIPNRGQKISKSILKKSYFERFVTNQTADGFFLASPVTIEGKNIGQKAINEILSPTSKGGSPMSVIGGNDGFEMIAGDMNEGIFIPKDQKPYIFESYLELYPDAKGEFFIEKVVIPKNVKRTANVASSGANNAMASTGSPSGQTPPPAPNPFYPFDKGGVRNGERKYYTIPNTSPPVIRAYEWDLLREKWILKSTSGGTGGGKSGFSGGPL